MNVDQYRNLVFRGGGILGIAYLGALKVIDDAGILPNIKRVSGASAGAITALITSMCTGAREIQKIANTLEFDKVPDKSEGLLQEFIDRTNIAPLEDIGCVNRLIKEYGWYTTDFFYNWLKDTIQGQFKKQPNVSNEILKKKGLQTFSDFKAVGFRDIYVSVTNVTHYKNEIFSIENVPDMPVADAVRMSMSIPLFFKSIEFNGCHYADGGTVNNYPIEVFDFEKYVDNPANFNNGINDETLGCHLFTAQWSEKNTKDGEHDTLIHYIESLFKTLMKVQTINFDKTPNVKRRSANINDLGISATNFDIEIEEGDLLAEPYGDKPYGNLYRSGYFGMKDYLDKLA